MNLIYLWLVLILNTTEINVVFGTDWINSVAQEIIKLNPYQSVIITSEIKSRCMNDKIREIFQIIPTTTVSLEEIIAATKNTSLARPVFTKSGETVIFFIFHEIKRSDNSTYIVDLRYFFHAISQLSPTIRRPKCLIIILSEKMIFYKKLQEILYYSWTMKFLDVTILTYIENSEIGGIGPIKHHYNPFIEDYYNGTWDFKSTLFPNKLLNMNGYPIKMCMYHFPPYVNITARNHDGSVKHVDGINYIYTTLLSRFLNFSMIHVVELNFETAAEFIEASKKLLDNDTINMMPIPMFSSIFNYRQHFEASIHIHYIKFVAFVPILPRMRVVLPDSLLGNFLTCSLFLITVGIIARLLKFKKQYWNIVNVVGVLLGQSITHQPPKLFERIIFICIVLLSMTYFNEVFSELMNVKIINDYQNFDTLEDMSNSGLKIFIEPYALSRIFPPDDESRQAIQSQLVNFSNITDCIQKLRESRNYICFAPQPRAKLMLEDYDRSDYKPVMKIAKVEIPFDWQAYTYEKASPYVKRFDDVLYRIIQSGISKSPYGQLKGWQSNNSKANDDNMQDDINTQLEQDNITIRQLAIILIMGYATSFIAFGIEFLFKTWQDKQISE